MNGFSLINLVEKVLPEDVDMAELKKLGKTVWWNEKQTLAIIYALRKTERLNWNAYLANNHDVMQAGVDPVLHFVRHGIHEGRKLYSWHPSRKVKTNGDNPKVSVVIPNYNNSVFLEYCLKVY